MYKLLNIENNLSKCIPLNEINNENIFMNRGFLYNEREQVKEGRLSVINEGLNIADLFMINVRYET